MSDPWVYRIEPVDKRVQDLQAQLLAAGERISALREENDRLRAQLAQANVETRP